jgi:hypothetical protein
MGHLSQYHQPVYRFHGGLHMQTVKLQLLLLMLMLMLLPLPPSPSLLRLLLLQEVAT